MKRWLLFLILFSTSILFAQTYTHRDSLRGGSRPERTAFNVYYYDIDVEVDIPNKFITGSVGIYFEEVEAGVNRMQIDLFNNMKVAGIQDANGAELTYTRDENAIFIDRKTPSKINERSKIIIQYEGSPVVAKRPPWDGGFIWTKDKNGNPWVAVACQGTGASLWWPNKDDQSDEADSVRISIIVPSSLVAISNGNLESKREMELKGKTQYNWFVSYPINNYNVSINIGKYISITDGQLFKGVETAFPVDYYVLDYNQEKAENYFYKRVVPLLTIFEEKLGPYPFPRDGYALIETPYLGMEHQSGIAYGNKYQKGYNGVERSGLPLGFDFIIVHETGHEYWGNSVGSKDVADMWIHEGFCTYSEALYVEEIYGADTALLYCNAWKLLVENDVPIIGDYGVNNEGSVDMYNKGALMLHTLRWLVDDDKKWYAMLKNIQKDYRFKLVSADELILYINQQLGKDYTWLFDQYLKNASPPVLHYELLQKGRNLEVILQWKEVKSNFCLPVHIKTPGGKYKSYVVTDQPQKIVLRNMKKADFKVDEQHAYFLIK
jgi:aminopeptidase N